MGGAGRGVTLPDGALRAVRAALRPIAPGSRVLLAVSGGPDSVGMAWLVVTARPDLRAAVVHVRHGLRDDRADAVAAVGHARALGLAWRVMAVTVVPGHGGPEADARQARMAALAQAAVDSRAAAVLVGHTADDQAETVLLNIARGAGLQGLAGMPALRRLTDGVALVRPVLALRRATVHDVAAATGLEVAVDPTNTDPDQRRSRARRDVLPRLAALTGGGTDPVAALARLARHARRDADALDGIAQRHLDRYVGHWGPVRVFPTNQLTALGEAVASRVLRRLVTGGRPPPSERALAGVSRLRDGQAAILSGGVMVTRGGGLLAVAAGPVVPLADRRSGADVALPELGLTLRRTVDAPPAPLLPPWAPARAAASVATETGGKLLVRARRAGDRIRTSAGTQKLSDAMASAGVPRLARDLVPVVEDEDGVLWVPGVAVRRGAGGPARLHLARS